jgi:hypothetical protein
VKIGICSIAYNPGGWTQKQLDSILQNTKHEVVTQLFLHNGRYPELSDECDAVANKYDIDYLPYGQNRGINRSMNDSFEKFFQNDNCDIVFCPGQDLFFNTPIAFDEWVDRIEPHIKNVCFFGHIPKIQYFGGPAPFCAFTFTRKSFETIGYLDENYFPAQYEDMDLVRRYSITCDFEYRMDIEGDTTHHCMLVRTDKELNRQQETITGPKCREYYIRKWGGDIGQERFTSPFNYGYDNYISHHVRHNPYNRHDRPDIGTVYI